VQRETGNSIPGQRRDSQGTCLQRMHHQVLQRLWPRAKATRRTTTGQSGMQDSARSPGRSTGNVRFVPAANSTAATPFKFNAAIPPSSAAARSLGPNIPPCYDCSATKPRKAATATQTWISSHGATTASSSNPSPRSIHASTPQSYPIATSTPQLCTTTSTTHS